MWSKHFNQCVLCCSTASRHTARGRCALCYAKEYKREPARHAKIEAQKRAWRERNREYVLAKAKDNREQRHYSGQRDAVLARDGFRCAMCQAAEKLVVHHKDREGRGSKAPNNDLENLVTLCRKCHIGVHRDEAFRSKHRDGVIRSWSEGGKRRCKT